MCVGAPCNSTVGCGPLFCSYSVIDTPNCTLRWTDVTSQTFLCRTSPTQGKCQKCPEGWTASGAYCVECELGRSCDVAGVALCEGQCASGASPTCDPSTGYVSCSECASNSTRLRLQNRVLTRGGVLDAPHLCEAYFRCEVGYYLTSSSDKTQLACGPCFFPENVQAGWAAKSQGLTFGDEFSCMYAPVERLNASNALGAYGDLQTSCPEGGFTSRAHGAATAAGCRACPNAPAGGRFRPRSFDCATECDPQFVMRGEKCVHSDRALIKCDGDGCGDPGLPWNEPGWTTTGRPQWTMAAATPPVAAMDLGSDAIGSLDTLYLSGDSLCDSIVGATSQLGYVQDKPLIAVTCKDTESHRFHLLCKGGRYLYAFLERSFGSNNRFVMWQVDTAKSPGQYGRVMQTWRLPGKVCSAAWSVLDGVEYVYAVFCGAPFVFFVRVAAEPSAPNSGTTKVSQERTQFDIGRRYDMLIGTATVGLADGQRDVARFGAALSVCNTSDPRRLLVADQVNCRMVEIIVDTPGSFLTRAVSIGEPLCYTSNNPLPAPRLLISILGGAWALFMTDKGLMQMDAATRTIRLAARTDEIPLEGVRWIGVADQGSSLVAHNGSHRAQARPGQVLCPAHHSSPRGGKCVPCPLTSYASGGACVPCSTPLCGPGTAPVPCGPGHDAHCRACTGGAPYAFRFDGNCTVVPTSPCPPGFYATQNVSGADCEECPVWYGPGAYDSVPQQGVCSCFPQGTMRRGTCEVPSPFAGGTGPYAVPSWVLGMNCTYQECQERGCYLSKVFPRTCAACPPGQLSVGGMWCETCPGFRNPTPAQDECVCTAPSRANADGDCVCPAGHERGGSVGCKACAPGDYQEEGGIVLAQTRTGCSTCRAGTESQAGALECTACGGGKFRETGMARCEPCASPTSYASEPSSRDSCTDCATGCPPSHRWDPCPVSPSRAEGWFTCTACPPLPDAAREYVPGDDNRGCWWQCTSGYYESEGECLRCTTEACPPGRKFTQCTAYGDRDCSAECVNATMPAENSVWTTECRWGCAAGFVLRERTVVAWTEYECVTDHRI